MSVLEFISRFRIETLDTIFRTISYCGEITILLPLICILYWCINKSLAYSALFCYFISGSVVQGAKIAFRIPRPWIINPGFQPVPSALETATGYSFPSGHVQSSSSIFLSIGAWCKNRLLFIICSIITGLVLFSRLYLGVHTPLDVFTSLAISVVTIIVIKHFGQNYIFPRTNKIALLMIAILYSMGLCFYSYILVRWNVSTIELVADSVIFAASLTGFSIGTYIENRFIGFRTKCFSPVMQIIKALLGLGGLFLIHYGCSLLPLHHMWQNALKGFLVCIFATCIFPIFIKCVQKKNYSEL